MENKLTKNNSPKNNKRTYLNNLDKSLKKLNQNRMTNNSLNSNYSIIISK